MGHRVALFCGMLLGAAALGTVAIHRATVDPSPGADGTVKTALLVPAAAAAERGLIERTWTHETHVRSTCGFNPPGFLD